MEYAKKVNPHTMKGRTSSESAEKKFNKNTAKSKALKKMSPESFIKKTHAMSFGERTEYKTKHNL